MSKQATSKMGWLTIREQTESVTFDVERIRSHSLVPREIAS